MPHHHASPRRRLRALAVAAVIASLFVVGGTSPASAATFTVTTTADGGPGSLRDAFAQASASGEPNEIVLQADAVYDLEDCAEGDLDYANSQPLTIVGNGSSISQVCPDERVIESGGDITLSDVVVEGGQTDGLGGGIEADTADVTAIRSMILSNEASTGGGIGAIRVTLVDSTVAGNFASTGAGVWADQTMTVTNSTVSANTASTAGGGLAVVNTSITLLYSTIAGNSAPVGANIQLQPGSDELVSFASVVGEPLGGGTDCDIDEGATTTSQGYNFSSDASCGFGGGTDDQSGAGTPALAALFENGGPTLTMLPDPDSPLIDAVDCAAAPESVTTDQRGFPRPHNTLCDIGAVEVQPGDHQLDTPVDLPPPPPPRPPDDVLEPRFTG